jgi:hypothetical protein
MIYCTCDFPVTQYFQYIEHSMYIGQDNLDSCENILTYMYKDDVLSFLVSSSLRTLTVPF